MLPLLHLFYILLSELCAIFSGRMGSLTKKCLSNPGFCPPFISALGDWLRSTGLDQYLGSVAMTTVMPNTVCHLSGSAEQGSEHRKNGRGERVHLHLLLETSLTQQRPRGGVKSGG